MNVFETLILSSFQLILTASLVLIGTGAGLMGFYRIHMLEVISIEFLIVPLILIVGGILALFTAIFGFYVTVSDTTIFNVLYQTIRKVYDG